MGIEERRTGETDCHTSDIGHWFAMTELRSVRCAQADSQWPSLRRGRRWVRIRPGWARSAACCAGLSRAPAPTAGAEVGASKQTLCKREGNDPSTRPVGQSQERRTLPARRDAREAMTAVGRARIGGRLTAAQRERGKREEALGDQDSPSSVIRLAGDRRMTPSPAGGRPERARARVTPTLGGVLICRGRRPRRPGVLI